LSFARKENQQNDNSDELRFHKSLVVSEIYGLVMIGWPRCLDKGIQKQSTIGYAESAKFVPNCCD
jgi:hypothetical protein